MAKDLLLEIGTEEMPPSAVDSGARQLKENASKILREHRLSYGDILSFGTPRRLVLKVEKLKERQEKIGREIRGPAKKVAYSKEGEPTPAALGFAQAQGAKVETLIIKSTPQGEYLFAFKEERGRLTRGLLPLIFKEIINSFSFPKSMRWMGDLRFIRPIRWLLALYGQEVIPFSLGNLKSSRVTFGHRFFSKKPLKIEKVETFFQILEKEKVILSKEKRRDLTLKKVKKVEEKIGGRAFINTGVLEETLNLVEFPEVTWGSFPKDFLKLPPEVLISVLEEHQRYFPVQKPKGRGLLPYFIVVHNGDSKYQGIIREGHERVIKARFNDAQFFYEADQKTTLEKRILKLKGVIFQEKLGTVFDKTVRLQRLVKKIGESLNLSSDTLKKLNRAAYLSKADLLTEMVTEFPTLQGKMGRIYAYFGKEDKQVAEALWEQYLPPAGGNSFPRTLLGKSLSLADRLDTIAGFFFIDLIPTASSDPYLLRRQAQGVISILLEAKFPLSLGDLINFAMEGFEQKERRTKDERRETKKMEVEEFFKGRIRTFFSSEGFKYDELEAVLTRSLASLSDLKALLEELSKFRKGKRIEDLLTAFTRCNNLAKPQVGSKIDSKLLQESAEKKLYQGVLRVEGNLKNLFKKRDFRRVLELLADLKPPVDTLFDEVLVMTEDKKIRTNRLSLLNKTLELFYELADFSKLVPETVD